MAFVEDLAPYFADFGDAGTLNGAAVRVIFDAPNQQQLAAGAGFMSDVPQVQLPTASVPANVVGMSLVIPQGSYTVREQQDDGTGVTVLLLRGAA